MVDGDKPQDRAGDEPEPITPPRAAGDVTLILARIEQGEPQAAEQLLPLVYQELRKLAAAKMAQEKPDQTLQATALVHEAYIRLVDVEKVQHWKPCGGSWSITRYEKSGPSTVGIGFVPIWTLALRSTLRRTRRSWRSTKL
jgi:hypothetical protein